MSEDRGTAPESFTDELIQIPFHRLLGLNADNFDYKNSCIRFDMRDDLVGNKDYNILHGGVISTFLDIEGAFILSSTGAWERTLSEAGSRKLKGGTINLQVEYLRPGKGKHFVVSGTILRRGSKVAVVRSELRNEHDELIAAGTGTYLIG